jgi:hypothetical protein
MGALVEDCMHIIAFALGVTPTISIKGAPPARLRIILGERLDHKGE